MTLGLVCDACDALSPVHASACHRCGNPLGVIHGRNAEQSARHRASSEPRPSTQLQRAPQILTPLPAEPSVRRCRTCGADVPRSQRFCGECGARLEGTAPPDGAANPYAVALESAARARLVLIKGEGLDSISYHLAGSDHVVGRLDGEILFPEDPLVSPRHANFFYRGSDLCVRDEASSNGVFLRIRRPVRLASDQPFLVGEQLLFVQQATVEGLAAADEEGTYYYGSPRRPARMRVVQVLAGGDVAMAMRVPGDVLSIGREGNQVNFPDDPFISGRHAQVAALDDGGFRLSDVGSKNGTFVRIQSEARLEHGDYLFVGLQLLRVEIG